MKQIAEAEGKGLGIELLYDDDSYEAFVIHSKSGEFKDERFENFLMAIARFEGMVGAALRRRAGDYYEQLGMNRFTGGLNY